MDMVATEVMRRCVQTVTPSMSLPELERAFLRAGVWGFPVVEDDRLVGVVSRSDIVHQLEFEHQTAHQTSDFYRDANGFHETPLATNDDIADRIGERMEQLTIDSWRRDASPVIRCVPGTNASCCGRDNGG
jgi:predicted transcriptional regulator